LSEYKVGKCHTGDFHIKLSFRLKIKFDFLAYTRFEIYIDRWYHEHFWKVLGASMDIVIVY